MGEQRHRLRLMHGAEQPLPHVAQTEKPKRLRLEVAAAAIEAKFEILHLVVDLQSETRVLVALERQDSGADLPPPRVDRDVVTDFRLLPARLDQAFELIHAGLQTRVWTPNERTFAELVKGFLGDDF